VPTKKEKQPLSVTHPELAKEADGWDPSKWTHGARGRFAWLCPIGHQYVTLMSLRTRSGTGCPICANKKVLKGFNDVATTHPELANEAEGWDPTSLVAGSHKKLKWKCAYSHEYEATLMSRSGKGNSGCPVCVNMKILVGYNDLKTIDPELASEADGWDPTTVLTGSNKRYQWKCLKGHTFIAAVSDRMRYRKEGGNLSSCPICLNQKVLVGFNDLATTHPFLVSEADGWDPSTVVAGTSSKRNWRCPKGHSYITGVSLRALRNYGCPFCANKNVLEGFNDLGTTDPDIAATAFNWDPRTVTRGSQKKKQWKCPSDHIYEAPPMARTGRKSGCPFCAHQKLLPGFNDLGTTNPAAAAEADGWDPTQFIGGNNAIKDWKCLKGHSYKLSIYRRDQAEVGCPFCGNRRVLVGFNDLATTHPELAKEADGWDPATVMAGSENKFKWKCSKDHKYSSVMSSRAFAGNGCPICANRVVVSGINDLLTTHPEIGKQADGWDASTVSYGNETKRWWICNEGHRFKNSPNGRTMGRGCPSCAESGYDPNKDAFLYFLSHSDWEMLQVGITNDPETRLKKHGRLGWELLEIRGPMDGHLTQQWETAILRMLKAKGADLSNDKIAGKFDGYSEAWSKSTFKANSIKDLMRLTEEFEGN
jgi:hypothetical protein